MSEACCTKGTPSAGTYTGKGTVKVVDKVKVYEVGSGPKTIVVIYDIFGLDIGNTRQFCDMLAEAGARVLMPDFFQGKPFPMENFPPANMQTLMDFFNTQGTWENVHTITEAVLKHYGVQRFAILGFCWGGMQALRYGADKRCVAGASIHGAMLQPALVEALVAPFYFVAAGDDPDLAPLKAVADKKPFGAQCVYKTYPTMQHGFCAARGDWSKPEIRTPAFEVLDTAKKFLTSRL